MTDYSIDEIYGNKLKIKQPQKGYRVSIDSILLQAALTPKNHESVLEVGSGVGAASLCLSYRCPDSKITGIEIQRENVTLANQNVLINKNLIGSLEFLLGDLRMPPPRLAAGSFDYVISNPPYYEESKITQSEEAHKNISNVLKNITLEQWIRFCLLMIKQKGQFVMIHNAKSIDQILACLHGKVGHIKIFPLWKSASDEATRVIIKAQKGTSGPTQLMHGLILHQSNGQYTGAAEDVLRYGKELII